MSVKFYNENAESFFKDTVKADMSYNYNYFIKNLPKKTGEILDLGCGSGRDSKYFIELGYKVIAIDLSPVLAEKASKYIGQDVIVIDMKNIDFKDKFIGVWACASLLHLSYEEVLETLNKIYSSLKNNGIVYASFKVGSQDYEKNDRKFTCFTKERFSKLIEKSDFYLKEIFETSDVRAGRGDEKWLNVILKKI
ncbi:MAG: class I SAM-dependent methyltransferase [Cetobacterium sp.]|uniref:class I SAM-dependent methyltransferase n=1 Tax=Cetobacterium sp. TaxID=2071632 RepID=UPI003EE69279